MREILREEKHRHGCRSDNKREVTAWESSPNQIARSHKTTRKTRATRCKSCTSRTQPLERRTKGEQANNKHFSLFLSRTNQTRKTQRLRDWLVLKPASPSLDAASTNAPAVGHHATTWRPRVETAHLVNGRKSPHNLSPPSQPTASAQQLKASCSLSAARQEQPGLGRSCGRKSSHHECRSDNKREVTAWESSTNQNARTHKTTRKKRATWHKSHTNKNTVN